MSKTAFLEQFDDEENLQEIQEDFLRHYAWGLADTEVQDALQYAVDLLNDEWELEPEATGPDVESWLEDEERLRLAKLRVQNQQRKENALQVFREKRGEGKTLMEIAKAAGEDPSYLSHTLAACRDFELGQDRLKLLRKMRQEEYQAKAFRARQKAYRMISSKVEKAMKKADFSSLPPDKLADIMLKLAQLTKEDEPPEMTIRLDWNREV